MIDNKVSIDITKGIGVKIPGSQVCHHCGETVYGYEEGMYWHIKMHNVELERSALDRQWMAADLQYKYFLKLDNKGE